MAKIAVELEQALAQRAAQGLPGRATARVLAGGPGWTVSDVVCTSGPQDRPFEERHAGVSIAIVVAGSFQYRSSASQELMTPGSLLLGNPGQCYECGHEHGSGDRCLSFYYAPDYFEDLWPVCEARSVASDASPARGPGVVAACGARLRRFAEPRWFGHRDLGRTQLTATSQTASLTGVFQRMPKPRRRVPWRESPAFCVP